MKHAEWIFLLHTDKDTLGFKLKLQTRPSVSHTEFKISFKGILASHIFHWGLFKVNMTVGQVVGIPCLYFCLLWGARDLSLFSSSNKVRLKPGYYIKSKTDCSQASKVTICPKTASKHTQSFSISSPANMLADLATSLQHSSSCGPCCACHSGPSRGLLSPADYGPWAGCLGSKEQN